MRNSNFSVREKAIRKLTHNLNKEHNTDLSYEQVEFWVGSDATVDAINLYAYEVEITSFEAVQPNDIISFWNDSQD